MGSKKEKTLQLPKSLILSSVFLILFSAGIVSVSAQSTDPFTTDQSAEIYDVEGLRAEFKQYTQDPETKIVKFEMILKSNIESDRVKITWSLNGRSVFTEGFEKIINTSVKSAQQYSIPVTIIPTGYGTTELVGKVEAFKADSTYLVTVRKNFASNESSEILPITQEYTNARIMYILKTVLIAVILLGVLGAVAFFGFKKFTKWLNK